MNLFYQTEISNGIHSLSGDESWHAVKVLRLKSGDQIDITDGKGCLYKAEITHPDPSQCAFTILTTGTQPRRPFHIHIAIAPTKNTDRMEWFVEKAVELGVDHISFILCENSERESLKMERLEKLAIGALKQSHQVWLPKLTPLLALNTILTQEAEQKFVAYVDHKNNVLLKSIAKPKGNYLVLIGPEGDFSPDELNQALANGFQKVSLGTSRLRTETAGLAACHILNLINT